jgi:guanylate kinase
MKGKAIFIMGPTGIGKSTTIRLLRERNPEFIYLPSYTDRAMRQGEIEGDPYFFITQQQFQDKIKNNDFLEYAFVHNLDYKGTNKKEIFDAVENGKIIYKEVELKGYLQIANPPAGGLPKEFYTTIFLYPHDPEIIKRRILKREPDMSTNDIQQRLKSFDTEMQHINDFDYKIQTIENGEEIVYEKVLEIFKKLLVKK